MMFVHFPEDSIQLKCPNMSGFPISSFGKISPYLLKSHDILSRIANPTSARNYQEMSEINHSTDTQNSRSAPPSRPHVTIDIPKMK